MMEIIQEGKGELLGWLDPDVFRKWNMENKSRELKDKRMTVKEVTKKFVKDGDFMALGGFGHVRVPMSLVYQIIREKRRNLAMAGKTAVHDIDLLVAAGCVNRVEAAYSFGHELRGLSPASRRAVESGKCKVVAEISNAGYQWRFLAAMMGIPFIPSRTLMGSDTLKYSSAKIVKDPFTDKPLTLFPACHPDVAIIHTHRCDIYGNAQIDGIIIEDFDLSRAAKRVIITAEEIIDNKEIRKKPWLTSIPFYVVDAVIHVPYGSHPCQMPLLYYFDEHHIANWLNLSKTQEGVEEYFDKYVYGVDTFDEYLMLIGGKGTLDCLQKVEQLRIPMKAS